MDSIVKNVNRLLTTIVLALFMIYLFALVGLLQFFDAHTDANVANQGWIDGNSTAEEGKAAGGDDRKRQAHHLRLTCCASVHTRSFFLSL